MKRADPAAQTALSFCLATALLTVAADAQKLPDVPVPKENPVTAQKTVLGKMLFWEEQLSSNNGMACGSCHQPRHGGSIARLVRHPGKDGKPGNGDDSFGAVGIGGTTERTPPSNLNALWSTELFWDGRAGSTFLDPLTGKPAIAKGGALESQALHPILNPIEMATTGRTWSDVTNKLAKARPMALATNLPKDVAKAVATHKTYPNLFKAAFGDEGITPTRIAFAIATYQRTLVADQTPYDKFLAGDPTAITPEQLAGLSKLGRTGCTKCHVPPLFTDHSYRNVGLFPKSPDTGRQRTSGRFRDRGKFKVPSLRNIGLRKRFMHDGRLTSWGQVFRHYSLTGRYGGNQHNLDNLLRDGMYLNARERRSVIDFVTNSLTDPRVKNETWPFDRPKLRSEQELAATKRKSNPR